jgi:hypothetical protein
MKYLAIIVGLFFLSVPGLSLAGDYPAFSFHRLESGVPGNTLVVVGGIQGDEPGGFNAASLLVTDYRIKSGSVWVVPNLNFISIIKRSRGVYGDLNRKFATIKECDPDFKTVQKIKAILLDSRVDLILNLHDGSGFYRTEHIDDMHSPRRWGQSIIIDQLGMNDDKFGDLAGIAHNIVNFANGRLLDQEHIYHVYNTETGKGNMEMSKTLTYFAVCNSKPAFGVEASKNLPTHKRAYYHLLVLEAYMDLLGIRYEKGLCLSSEGVRNAIRSNVKLSFYDNRIFLDMKNARKRLGYVPLKKDSDLSVRPSSPLIAVIQAGDGYRVYHGNRSITELSPQFFEYDCSIDSITMEIDGIRKHINFGAMVDVERDFTVLPEEGYRVNVIGFKGQEAGDESGIPIRRDQILPRFSVDRKASIFRVEVYREEKFSGMVLVNFSGSGRNICMSKPTTQSDQY